MSDLTVEFGGESFGLADKIGLMPLMKLGKLAKSGVDADTMDGISALYDMLEQIIVPADWDRFVDVATRERSDASDFMALIGKAMQELSARPTRQPSDSSDGLVSIPGNSAGDSSSVVERLEEQGRPDLALVVEMARSA